MIFSGCSPSTDLCTAPTAKNYHNYDIFLLKNAPSQDAFIALQRMSEPLLIQKKWNETLVLYQNYREHFATSTMNERFDKITNILEAETEGLILTNLAFSINTAQDEYAPVLSFNEKLLYFTGNSRVGGSESEDIFVSELKNGQWETAQNIGYKINTRRKNESLDAISPDGSTLFLMGNFSDGFGLGDLYSFEKSEGKWGDMEHLPTPVNTRNFEGNAYMTANGQALLFTSDRPGGTGAFNPKGLLFNGGYIGNTDIYITQKTEEGWSEPINLGSIINTPFAEYSPFLHPDGKTLYFSSDGHPGLGRMDVFKSTRLDEKSWTKWSEPVNLGKEINTPENDWAYRISLSGEVAYFATAGRKDGMGAYDIYTITLPKKVRPNAVTIVKGSIYDDKGIPLSANLVCTEKASGIIEGQFKTNETDGSYMIVLKPNKEYVFQAKKTGYYPSKKILATPVQGEDDILIFQDLTLMSFQEIKEKEIAITLNDIFFEFNKFNLLATSYPELNRLASLLIENPNYIVEISGHTDNVGSAEYNIELSENRAQAVVDYLISAGCQPAKLKAKGYGFKNPIDTNETEEGRAMNRRVEFRLE